MILSSTRVAGSHPFSTVGRFISNPKDRLWVFDPELTTHKNLLKLCTGDSEVVSKTPKRKLDSDSKSVFKKGKTEI